MRPNAARLTLLLLAAAGAAPSATAAIPASQRDGLVALYDSTAGSNWSNRTGWLGAAGTECSWAGVRCDDARTTVVGLELYGNNLVGLPVVSQLPDLVALDLNANPLGSAFPPSFTALAKLESLRIAGCGLTGNLPASLGQLAQLRELYAPNNSFSGPVPAALGGLSNLAELVLYGNQLTGPIPAALGSLSKLTNLDLDDNALTGPIPKELGGLSNLRSLYLQRNQLSGEVPPELGALAKVEILALGGNALSGPIPAALGSLGKLELLYLDSNELTGEIPAALGNASALRVLQLGSNQLGGSVPSDVSRLAKLEELYVYGNRLTSINAPALVLLPKLARLDADSNPLAGPVPPEVGSLVSLTSLSLANCRLAGPIPFTLGNLTKLERLGLGGNELTGPIPPALGNLSNLTTLDLSSNLLTGAIPPGLGGLAKLEYLYLGRNQLVGEIAGSLGALSRLVVLALAGNQLTGPIPPALGSLAALEYLDLSENKLSGALPAELANLTKLQSLALRDNLLGGGLPDLSSLGQLRELDVSRNLLGGSLPAWLGSLSNLQGLSVRSNQFGGTLPAELSALSNLQYLYFDGNLISGTIPPSFGNLAELLELSGQANLLGGSIPSDLGRLTKLVDLNLSFNELSGPIPAALGDLAALRHLGLSRNRLSGPIPSALGGLSSILYLELAQNRLSGELPAALGGLASLNYFDVSGNLLSGDVPATFAGLSGLANDYGIRLDFNALRASSTSLLDFLVTKGGDFTTTQTTAPPGLNVGVVSTSSVTLRWSPIIYQYHAGGYEVLAGPAGGALAVAVSAPGKDVGSATVQGLTPGVAYRFAVRAYTSPHENNPNRVVSEASGEVTATTKPPGSLAVSLAPASQRVLVGGSATLTATLSAAQPGPTSLTLTSSNGSLATVPASVSVPAGVLSASFSVSGQGPGSAYVTATVPAPLGGASAAADVVVSYSACEQPNTPSFTSVPSAPVRAGSSVPVAWVDTLAADPSGSYQVDVSPNADCATGRKRYVTPEPSLSIPTESGLGATYCLVVRAVSGAGCASGDSAQATFTVQASPATFVVARGQTPEGITAAGVPAANGTVVFRNIGSQASSLALASRIGVFTPQPASVSSVPPGGTVEVQLLFDPLTSVTPAVLFDSLCGTWTEGSASRSVCTAVTLTTLATAQNPDETGGKLRIASSNEVHFIAQAGASPPTQTVTVTNAGTAPVRLVPRIGPGGAWLNVGADALATPIPPGGSRTLVLSVDRSRRATAEGRPPLATDLVLAAADGSGAGRTSVALRVFDEEPVALDAGAGRAALAANDYSFLLPTSVSASGIGTYFLSDGWIRNTAAVNARATLYYTPNGGDGIGHPGVKRATVDLAPYTTYRLADFVRGLFGTSGSGSVEIRSPQIASLEVRTTVDSLTTKNGSVARFGAEIPTVKSREGTSLVRSGAPLALPGVKGGAGSLFRTNVILAETSGRSVTVALRLFKADGTKLAETSRSVLAYSKLQINAGDASIFPPNVNFDGATLEVTPTDGLGSVAAFATVIDNVSQAYTTRTGRAALAVEAAGAAAKRGLAAVPAVNRLVIPAVARVAGANNSFFTTNVAITNLVGTAANVTVRYVPDAAFGAAPPSKPLTVPGRQTANLADVLTNLFGIASNSAGMLFFEGGDVAKLVISSETSTPLDPLSPDKGSSPSTLAAYAPESPQAVGDPTRGLPSAVVSHPGLEESSRFRTNLILAEVNGVAASGKVRIFLPGSGGVSLAELPFSLQPFERKQLNSFIRSMAGTDPGAVQYLDVATQVEWSSNGGRVLAVATKIDNDPESKRIDIYVLGPTGSSQGTIGLIGF